MITGDHSEEYLSPLDQIRLAEAELTRQVAAARESVTQILVDAQTQGAAMVEEARLAGQREGQARFRDIIANAEEEAQSMRVQARNQVFDLRQQGAALMETAVEWAVDLIIGPQQEANR